MNENPNAVAKSDKEKDLTLTEYIPAGGEDPIKLSVSIIQNLVAVPTAKRNTCSRLEALKVLALCKGKRLNPFTGDFHLVGYDDSRTGVAKYSMIIAEQAFLKRAEANPEYDGLESGLIIMDEGEKNFREIQGEFVPPGFHAVGGWAKLHFKTRKIPMYETLDLKKMRDGKFGPFWEKNPEHQIAKCARVAVLRRAFPNQCGGLYAGAEGGMDLREEISRLPAETSSDTEQQSAKPIELQSAGQAPVSPEAPGASPAKAQTQLAEFVKSEGFTFEQFHQLASSTGQFGDIDPENIQKFDDIPEAIAKRLFKARALLRAQLEQLRNQEAK